MSGDEITFLVQPVGAGHACVSLLRALEGRNVLATDLQALNTIHSLTVEADLRLDATTILPRGLQTLSLGDECSKQRLQGLLLPSCLQSLTFGQDFNQSLEGIELPSNLQVLTFGTCFNQSLRGYKLPGSLQKLEFGLHFNQNLEGVTLPGSLEVLKFGARFLG